MKTKKLLGSIALTAALAMGTMPAFASIVNSSDNSWLDTDKGIGGTAASTNLNVFNVTGTSADPSDPKNLKTGTGSTTIKASVFDADLNVTVPMVVSVAFSSAGGPLTCPSASAYQIYNNSTTKAVKLTKISGTSTGFTLATATDITNANGSPAAGQKLLRLNLNMNGTDFDLRGLMTQASPGELATGQQQQIPVAANATTPTGLPIQISGETNEFQTPLASAGYLSGDLATITYTVQVA